MKQNRYGIAIAVLGLATLVLLTGCDWTVEVYPSYSINGEVINAVVQEDATNSKLTSPTVILENSDGVEVGRTSVFSNGSFQFSGVTPGVYTVTAEQTGYAFVDRTVELTGAAVENVVLIGFPTEDEYTISIFVIWGDETDIDAYLSFPETYTEGTSPPVMAEPYQIATADNGYTPTYISNAPDHLASTNRFVVGWPGGGIADAERTSTTVADVYGGTDDRPVAARLREVQDGPGPETIQLRGMPFNYDTAPATPVGATLGGANTRLAEVDGNYDWLGTAVYYLDAAGDNATIADEGDPGTATPVVIVAQGAEVKGRYYVPDFTTLDTISVLRINMLLDSRDEVYQFVPDLRVVTPKFEANSASDDGILVLRGRPRQ
jgi:hypothetical protein